MCFLYIADALDKKINQGIGHGHQIIVPPGMNPGIDRFVHCSQDKSFDQAQVEVFADRALLLALLYTILHFNSYYQLIFLLPVPLLISDINKVITNTVPVELNRELKRLAVATLLFSISFGIGLVL